MNKPSIYESLGLKAVINAAGTFTELGGSIMPAPVRTAWLEAAEHFVDLRELQDCVGTRIAKMLQVESALVTGGAASSILLGLAGALTLRDERFPLKNCVAADGQPYEVIRQKAHRDLYDRQLETCGVKIVEVTSEDELNSHFSDRTVLMMSYNVYEPKSAIPHEAWLERAKQHGVPTLLDAAADIPPVDNLWRFNKMGYDMVAFSGGKAIRGPQSSGLLVGSARLVDAAKLNAVPNEGAVGRVAKVSKEDIIALWRALELFLAEGATHGNHIANRCRKQLRTIESLLRDISGLEASYVTPAVANHFPHLLLKWNETQLGLTNEMLAQKLRDGTPAIATGRVYGTGSDGLLISAINLQANEEVLVGQRLQEIFLQWTKASAGSSIL
ncbi:MAG: selenocysteine synthase [Planctomycetaceae bacterium]|nr:selenocysteine synthase [Planctomycetaceae bacterium]